MHLGQLVINYAVISQVLQFHLQIKHHIFPRCQDFLSIFQTFKLMNVGSFLSGSMKAISRQIAVNPI